MLGGNSKIVSKKLAFAADTSRCESECFRKLVEVDPVAGDTQEYGLSNRW